MRGRFYLGNNELATEKFYDNLTKVRQHLHQNPELSNQEFETTRFIRNYLDNLGINIIETDLKTGLIAEIGHGDGPTIALRADIDALPIIEATNLPYASTNEGVMHACGHDFHTASLLGAAELLKAQEAHLEGRILLLFQPAEEINSGAREVLALGLLKDVDAIIGFHNKPDLPVGTIGIKEGPLMAAVDRFFVTIKGEGTHAAAPHNGHDPIVTASQLVTALQTIVSRQVNPMDAVVVSVTHIDGGNTWNVIPDKVIIEGTIRTFQPETQVSVKKRFEQIVENVTAAFSQSGTVEWLESPPVVLNDSQLAEIVEDETKKIATTLRPALMLGGEDFAYYQQKIPGFFAFIGTDSPYEWHHPSFLVDDQALPVAINYYINNSLRLLKDWPKSR